MSETSSHMQTCHAAPFRKKLRSFWPARRGNITVMFAILLVPLLGFTGLAIDFGQVLVARHTAQMAADSAALYASGVAKTLIQNSSGSSAAIASSIAEAIQRATAVFNANIAKASKQSITGQVSVTKDGLKLSSTATFTVSTSASFGTMFGKKSFTASGSAKSTSSLPPFTNTYMVLDVSQSMGLASTIPDAQNFYKIIYNLEKNANNGNPKGCVFGCHVPVGDSRLAISYQQVAADNNIKLRIDVLRDAVTNAITTAQTDSVAQNTTNYKIGLYTMGVSSTNNNAWTLNQLSPLSSDWGTLKSAASTITLGPNNSGGTGDSYMSEQLNSLYKQIPSAGDGSTSSAASTYLFLVTDGLRDVPGGWPCQYNHCTKAFDPNVCTQYKNANITVIVIYTTYLPILKDPSNGTTLEDNYKTFVQPYAATIAPNLKACASGPKWYAEASDGPSISKALAEMFEKTTLQPTLTN